MSEQSVPRILLQELVELSESPWIVVLVNCVQKKEMIYLQGELLVAFQDLADKLLFWWPGCESKIINLYNDEFRKCWELYDDLRLDDSSIKHLQKLLIAFYIQFKYLRDFEKREYNSRSELPNDLREIGISSVIELIEKFWVNSTDRERQNLTNWMEYITKYPSTDWETGQKDLLHE